MYADHVDSTEDILNVYRWDGKLTCPAPGVNYPAMFDEPLNGSWLDHVTLETIKFSKNHPLDIVFLNQVSGKTPNNVKYAANIINHVDKCIQASNRGPDSLPYPYPCTHDLQATTTMKDRTIQDPVIQTVSTGHSPIFTANRHANRQRQCHRRGSCESKMKRPTHDCG